MDFKTLRIDDVQHLHSSGNGYHKNLKSVFEHYGVSLNDPDWFVKEEVMYENQIQCCCGHDITRNFLVVNAREEIGFILGSSCV